MSDHPSTPTNHPARPAQPDWTRGAPKWAAVAVLGGSSALGLIWSVRHREPASWLRASRPTLVEVPARAPADPRPEPIAAPERAHAAIPASAGTLNLNTATAAELELLPGIGPALARRIVDHRAAHGPFGSIEALDAVEGLGPKTIERIRAQVRVD